MGCYTDKNGKKWTFEITYGFVLYMKQALKIDLLEPYSNGNNTLDDLVRNNYSMIEVLFQAVKYSNKDVKDNEIWESFNSCEESIREAFFNDWANFSQSRGRKDVAAAIQKANVMLKAAINAAEAEINAIDSSEAITRIFQQVRESQQTPTQQSGKSQDD